MLREGGAEHSPARSGKVGAPVPRNLLIRAEKKLTTTSQAYKDNNMRKISAHSDSSLAGSAKYESDLITNAPNLITVSKFGMVKSVPYHVNRCSSSTSEIRMDLDRLPNSVIEEILGRLPIQDAVRTSLLSRSWRHRWQSTPRLAFNETSFPPRLGESDLEYKCRLAKAVDRALLLHTSPISEFRLSCTDLENWVDVDVWLQVLSRKGVGSVGLCFCQGFPYKLPSYLFECELLGRMELYSCDLKLPETFKGFRHLVALHLERLIVSGADLRRLISGCPILEELQLSQCRGFDVTICAPKLRKLTVGGCFMYLHLKHTPVLAAASICLSALSGLHAVIGGYGLAELCSAAPQIENLVIGGHFLTLLSAIGHIPERLPHALSRLKNLTIDLNFEDLKECEATLCLLRSCCSLQILKINHQHRPYALADTGVEAELVWEARKGLDEFDKLTAVEITRVACLGSAIAFMRFVVAAAANLVRLDVGLDKKVLDDDSKFKEVAKDLFMSCPRASGQGRIVLLD
ncbi:hypothetical protein Taro_001660 [Colocasia esculenta]|uniref:F-box domain-containing protein n=1 Tax=Colocasia esculenta TaxID=4460 RepID=A0A843TF64_COLES|nr:hypothetical protein [Colocasia esculenta]